MKLSRVLGDFLGIAGIIMFGYGLWLYSEIAMFVGIGIMLIILAMLPYLQLGGRDK